MGRMAWLVGLVTLGACSPSAGHSAAVVGDAAPAFTAQDLQGAPVALASLRGKVVVLNEWATWCEPCRGEIPQLEALYKRFEPQGLVMVGVSIDAFGTGADVSDFVREHDMTYPIWLDPDKHFSTQFLTIGVPETFVVDRAGRITHRHIGALVPGDSSLATAIRKALASDH